MPPDESNIGGTNGGTANQPAAGTGTPPAGGTQTAPEANPPPAAGGTGTPPAVTTTTAATVAGTTQAPPAPPAGPPAGIWPPDWRTQLAGDDKTFLGQLERFASPNDLAKKIREQDKLISSGQLKSSFPKDGTPEQISEWRKENGLPESPDKYDLTLRDGYTIGEQDKPIVDNMLVAMHRHNLSPDAVKDILATYYDNEKLYTQSMTNAHETAKAERMQQTEDELHKEWGAEYRSEINRVNNQLNTFSTETQLVLENAKDGEGMPILNNIHFLRDMAVLARIVNPVSTVVAGGGANQMTSVETEIAAIEARMGGVDPNYYKDDKAQARYLELITWRDNQKKRA